ncbi:MAG: hypothetical protein BGO31_04540 [Bacteroidetes bacterium 43-16]|nr:MAG: hypothetical protein BGO31_04540 [Bacteroidetes bacterium 43-16]
MQTGVLKYENNTLQVNRLGQGKQLLFAFHDFGQHAEVFAPLERALGHRYTIIAIEIPGLGHSIWQQKQVDKLALVTIIERFKLEFKVEKFDLLALGFGALYALSLMEQRSEWIEKVVLFAPDGLRRSSWQSLATRHFYAKGRIKAAIAQPEKAAQKLKGIRNWGILKKEWTAPLDDYIKNDTVRSSWNQVYPLHYKLVPEIQKVRWNVKKNKIELHMYCPEHALVLKKDALKFAKKQDFTVVNLLPEADFENIPGLLNLSEAIFNPRQ